MGIPARLSQVAEFVIDEWNDAKETRGDGAMTYPHPLEERGNDAAEIREETYTGGGAMRYSKTVERRYDHMYSTPLDRNNMTLGAAERNQQVSPTAS
ncbi:hypothetical protein DHEL01_v208726 [Diaporthe helianthi]|uniref:Uncharacterized protein n=1 Tax=Diaporthe helianthi TaxID=158607 RepID=A0A2P5HRP8_DIAHE|nr:hypothetical protein DHEL01_v208726 [Diaporthe helianthi]